MAMDENTVAQAQQGDVKALAAIVRRYGQPIERYFFRLSRDAELAKDLRQELFYKLLKVLPRYDVRRASFKTWLYRLARNLAIDRIFRATKRNADSLPEDANIADAAPGPHESAAAGELDTAIMQLISELDEIDQNIIAMKHEAEMTFEQIGQTLGIPTSTVKSRLYRTFETLREKLTRRGHRWHGGI